MKGNVKAEMGTGTQEEKERWSVKGEGNGGLDARHGVGG